MDHRLLPPPPPNAPFRGVDYHRAADGLSWLHGLFSLLIVLALIAGAIYLVRMFLSRPMSRSAPPSRNAAAEELDLRYARGEIERVDYLQRHTDLLDRSLRAAAIAPQPPGDTGATG